jgi:hypothetical protein
VGLLLFLQLRDMKRTVQSNAHVWLHTSDLTSAPISCSIPIADHTSSMALRLMLSMRIRLRCKTIAELFLNNTSNTSSCCALAFCGDNRPELARFCRVSLQRSPVLRQHVLRNSASYADALQASWAIFTSNRGYRRPTSDANAQLRASDANAQLRV